MASDAPEFALIPHKIVKGPPKIDLLEALFFHREKILGFDLANRTQVFVDLLGAIPCTHAPQCMILIVSYFAEAGCREKTKAVMVYDTHNRNGRFAYPKTIPKLLELSWY